MKQYLIKTGLKENELVLADKLKYLFKIDLPPMGRHIDGDSPEAIASHRKAYDRIEHTVEAMYNRDADEEIQASVDAIVNQLGSKIHVMSTQHWWAIIHLANQLAEEWEEPAMKELAEEEAKFGEASDKTYFYATSICDFMESYKFEREEWLSAPEFEVEAHAGFLKEALENFRRSPWWRDDPLWLVNHTLRDYHLICASDTVAVDDGRRPLKLIDEQELAQEMRKLETFLWGPDSIIILR